MNVRANGKNIDWKRVAIIAVVLLVAGYQYSRPTLEKWFDRELPSFAGQDDNQAPSADQASDRVADGRYDARLPDAVAKSKSKSTTQSTKNAGQATAAKSGSSGTDYLTSIGRNKFQSPAGLIYTMGPRGEHRVDHVMRHGRDMPNRPVHSVFDGTKNEILAVIDEAYGLVKSGSPQARSSKSRGNDEHLVRMNRQVGYEGGQKGKRKGYPPLRSVKLILDGNRVITAFPNR